MESHAEASWCFRFVRPPGQDFLLYSLMFGYARMKARMAGLVGGNCRGLVLLTEEEWSRLAEAVNRFHVPRSFLILEAIQAGLQDQNATSIPGRRNRPVNFRLPAEVTEAIKETAKARGVSQQSLIRHLLFAYLSEIRRKTQGSP